MHTQSVCNEFDCLYQIIRCRAMIDSSLIVGAKQADAEIEKGDALQQNFAYIFHT